MSRALENELVSLTGETNFCAALVRIEEWRRSHRALSQREHPKGVDDDGASKKQPTFRPAPAFKKNGATPAKSNPRDAKGWESVLYISSAEAKWGPIK